MEGRSFIGGRVAALVGRMQVDDFSRLSTLDRGLSHEAVAQPRDLNYS